MQGQNARRFLRKHPHKVCVAAITLPDDQFSALHHRRCGVRTADADARMAARSSAGARDNSMIGQGQYYRLLTAMLLHIGLVHLLCNCFSLNTVGPIVEMLFGTERMVITYILASLGGNLLSFSLTQASSMGASGVVFGLVGAFGVYVLRHRELYGKRSDRTLNSIMKTCLLNVCIGLIPCMRINNCGHLGGAVVGATVGYLFGPNLIKTRWGLVDQPLIAIPSLR